MNCNFNELVRYLDRELDLDRELELFDHLDSCATCRDAIYYVWRDRDRDLFVFRPYRADKVLID